MTVLKDTFIFALGIIMRESRGNFVRGHIDTLCCKSSNNKWSPNCLHKGWVELNVGLLLCQLGFADGEPAIQSPLSLHFDSQVLT